MKFLSVEVTLSEDIVGKPSPLRKTEAAKKAWLAMLPLCPIAYYEKNRTGDKTEVDDWTREIRSVKEQIKVSGGRVYYRVTLTLPNYIDKDYEREFLIFALGEIGRLNTIYNPKVIAYKFDGNVSIIDAISDSTKEKKENYIDKPIDQVKDTLSQIKEFARENKGLIIGGVIAIGILSAIAIIKK